MDDPWSERDECGAELTKDARVWKVYVKEADKSDTELVDGWNKSLDVILVFAALFSAVSTAFLIESSKMLKQDPNDVSAAALVVISQALVAFTSNSSVDLVSLGMPGQSSSSPFVPAHNAVLINTLWYLLLATSIATSFLAMLAKDWCRSFETGRSGHPWEQAQRRQRKWMMIEQCKMHELILVLPSLIHVSLSFFTFIELVFS
ncbi:DNA-directed RNA polymerase subunit beta' [Rhizoctonia solani]|uniref:DNA-directed RNA polymerase subunit beta n=1 Tax=Rhizoctonia solani TaxID=456999 RepID=A0A8H8SVW6_9AGAM|nr:DNA-directed RNA polymerase subunit beta' [Rhizoctonia solani]QRW18568.1 DNA-directed RNA polymerase subunit beta' [Rhizoctonia solani]